MNIQDIIKLGENSVVEFKSENFHNNSLAKEIVAFANFHGGTVYIGIDDNGNVNGILDTKIEEKIVNICRNNIIPSIIPQIKKINFEDKQLIELFIEKGINKPYKVKTSNKYYIRAGSVSTEPTNEELIRLFQEGELIHFEVSSLFSTSMKDIDQILFREYCSDYRTLNIEEIDLSKVLYNWQLSNEDGNLTVVGALCFSKNPNRYLPQSGIDLFCFKGADAATEIMEMKSLNAGIPYIVDSVINFIQRNSKAKPVFNSNETKRTDIYEFPLFAVRELISNAFMHRDWSIFGQKIRLSIFDDRLEIFSPGRLPNTMNLIRAINGVSYYRNPIIAQLLKDYGFVEKAGRGLLKIMNYYNNNKLKLPAFEDDSTFFKVTLYKILH